MNDRDQHRTPTTKAAREEDRNCNYFGIECQYNTFAAKAARDLGYGQDVVDQVKACTDDSTINAIMRKARREKFRDGFEKEECNAR